MIQLSNEICSICAMRCRNSSKKSATSRSVTTSVVHVYTSNAYPATHFRWISHKLPIRNEKSLILQFQTNRATPASEIREAVLLQIRDAERYRSVKCELTDIKRPSMAAFQSISLSSSITRKQLSTFDNLKNFLFIVIRLARDSTPSSSHGLGIYY